MRDDKIADDLHLVERGVTRLMALMSLIEDVGERLGQADESVTVGEGLVPLSSLVRNELEECWEAIGRVQKALKT